MANKNHPVIVTMKNGEKFARVSNWLTFNWAEPKSPRHKLWDYMDEGGCVDYFTFNGEKYALSRFMRCGNPWFPIEYSWEDEDGKMQFLSGVDCEEYWNPIYIELDEAIPAVRVYLPVTNG